MRFIQIFLVFGVDKEDHLRKWELRELGIDLSHLNPTLKLESHMEGELLQVDEVLQAFGDPQEI